MTFHVVSHEGSVIVSCATSNDLNLIQPHSELNDRVPDCSRLIYSCDNDPDKHTYKKAKPKASKTKVTQWKNQDVQKENKQQKCQAPSSTVFNNKNCQAERNINMLCGQ